MRCERLPPMGEGLRIEKHPPWKRKGAGVPLAVEGVGVTANCEMALHSHIGASWTERVSPAQLNISIT